MNRPIRPKKSLGQNFLIDPNYQKKIIAALELDEEDRLIEIGPGTGALTQHLVGNVHLTAIELDDQLAAALKDRYADVPSFHVVHEDVMKLPLSAVADHVETVKVVGNIPYNITSPLIFKLLERDARPALIVVMVQKEVADRIVAPPGDKDFGALSVGVQAVAEAERLFVVPRGAFRPVPKVDSAVVRIVPRRPFELTPRDEADLRDLTRAAFAMRRKQFQKILRSAAGFELDATQVGALEAQMGFALTVRPEELSATQFVALSRLLRAIGYPTTSAAS
ncbi:MAG TPA: 16S rRNA (adenine(1518)-N(6)/adenine(1519)-N(6))-dimethyltransferase RsmA [Longimicrobiales bacterium]|nr:16S rRNA (adenine(1518)-N(6)/adenine(1519)-N(6))-dimethyltransferase RsmA [Longimicrobiales bacterium]